MHSLLPCPSSRRHVAEPARRGAGRASSRVCMDVPPSIFHHTGLEGGWVGAGGMGSTTVRSLVVSPGAIAWSMSRSGIPGHGTPASDPPDVSRLPSGSPTSHSLPQRRAVRLSWSVPKGSVSLFGLAFPWNKKVSGFSRKGKCSPESPEGWPPAQSHHRGQRRVLPP